jgi:hypothetical protein
MYVLTIDPHKDCARSVKYIYCIWSQTISILVSPFQATGDLHYIQQAAQMCCGESDISVSHVSEGTLSVVSNRTLIVPEARECCVHPVI